MSANVFELLRDVSSVDAAHALGLRLNRKGNKHWTLCPLHSDRKAPSMAIYEGSGGWYCYGCHAGGDAVKLYELVLGMEPIDAAYALASAMGIQVPDRDEARQTAWQPSPEAVRRAAMREARQWFNQHYSQIADAGHAAFAAALRRCPEHVVQRPDGSDPRDALWDDKDFLQAVRIMSAAEENLDRLDAVARSDDDVAAAWMRSQKDLM